MRAAEQVDQPEAGASAGPVSNEDMDSDCACAGTMDCAPCVARAPLPQRVAAIRAALAAEPEPLVAITLLLQLCRDEHPVLWEQVNDPGCRARVATIMADTRALLTPSTGLGEAVLDPQTRRALVNALTTTGDLPAVVVARALAELLDERYAHSFWASFRRRSPYQPGVGDPIPLDSPDLRDVTELPATSPPWRLANRLDETRHVRLAGEWATRFQVIFDYSLAESLTGLIGQDTVVATCHPNRELTEFDFPLDRRGRTFPVHPADLRRQRIEIDRLITTAVAAGASIVVLPELCVTESMALQLQDWTCRTDGPRLLVAGSYHHDDAHPAADRPTGPPRRRNTAIAFVRGQRRPLTHDKHSPADRPVNEDIQPQGWPILRVYVSTDGWHLVIAICRDLLNPQAVHALTEAGVNLALVPAMSETLVAFGGPVAHLVGAAQAIVAVANNPADFTNSAELLARRPARALFGHPGFGQQTRLVQPADSEPGVALLRVRTGQLQWLAASPPVDIGQLESGQPSMLPPWASDLARQTGRPLSQLGRQPPQITLRPAAVLVLLTDGPDGPAALLTERAPDLTHYPGQLVFPGGACDPGDDGPVTTALREAAEEVGLDPTSVQILGVLPVVALPDSGFLMTPVLAWSQRPVFTGSTNLAEVSTLVTIALRRLPHPHHRPGAGTGLGAPATGPPFGAATLMIIGLLKQMLSQIEAPGPTGALTAVQA